MAAFDDVLAGCTWADGAEGNVADRLLGSMWTGEGWFRLGREHGASFRRLDLDGCLDASAEHAVGSFARVDRYRLPDNAPAAARRSRRYVVRDPASLLRSLRRQASALRSGARVSNVGGRRSDERAFDGDAGAWYAPLRALVAEALAADGALAKLSGWLNGSGDADANALHDHGDAAFACVFFVDGGAAKPPHRDAGHLLLRTQLKAFTHEYAYVAVPPTPGTCGVPGRVHAVLPLRATPRRASGSPSRATRF
ncbi:hypothetical protein JL722_986 [Aureococcus anophagefferens]|nr:hypothetical protein JL722_986 [Aureococcus anophagefferens]